ncbi:MAG: PHP domain-containing protein [Solirubrobacterales bacterium]
MTSTVDLHMHTNASDGASSPTELIDECVKAGLKTISFTDHENIDGYLEALAYAKEARILLIPGVELLTTFRRREIHLLGYGFDPINPQFRARLEELRQSRNNTGLRSAEKFQKLGFSIQLGPLIDVADRGRTIGKNHLIYALFEAGYIKTWDDVIHFLRNYLSVNGQAYIEFDDNPIEDGIEMIRQAGGIPVLAHPGLIRDDQIVRELAARRNIGIEVYYFYFGPMRGEWIRRYEALAREFDLLVTGGSDYHGYYAPDVILGELEVPENVAAGLFESLG